MKTYGEVAGDINKLIRLLDDKEEYRKHIQDRTLFNKLIRWSYGQASDRIRNWVMSAEHLPQKVGLKEKTQETILLLAKWESTRWAHKYFTMMMGMPEEGVPEVEIGE